MDMNGIPFVTTDWSQVERTEHPGETGTSHWRTRHFGTLRVRMVEYSPGYLADHWCVKGHVLPCMDGELNTELKDGGRAVGCGAVLLTAGHGEIKRMFVRPAHRGQGHMQ